MFDPQGVSTAIQTVTNMPGCTVSMRKMGLIAGVRLLQSIATFEKELVDDAMREIDELEDEPVPRNLPFVELPPTKFGSAKDEDEEESEDED